MWLDRAMDHRMEAADAVATQYYNQDPRLLRFVLSKPPDRVKYTQPPARPARTSRRSRTWRWRRASSRAHALRGLRRPAFSENDDGGRPTPGRRSRERR